MIPISQMTMSIGDDLDEDNVHTNVLPALLAYQDDELVYTWLCVDWEAEGIGGLQICWLGLVRV
jgi:hypothetical protein